MTDDGFPEENSSSQNEDGYRRTKSDDEQFCSSCGEVIKKKAEICPECGVRQKRSNSGEKNPGISAVLSFFITGAGQIYNGEIGKGIGLMVLQVVNVLLMAVLIGFITFPATWIWAIYDAYKTAEKINTGE
ncbi:zinc ribbon domain-containing protein [Natrinema soli]|uniref:Zinc ribbon domain-containing protein n=1 Tax=Natrinema soli TaxID=1930624 RepID=A0ABD5SWZ4_9EURY|nr:zinc ribbon domain-containing protein [Natrinema soli]